MKVAIYEPASEIMEVGAAIQIEPNMFRSLRRWELLDALRSQTIDLDALSLRRYAIDSELARVLMIDIEKIHGAPLGVAYRADLMNTLERGAGAAGAKIITGAPVEDVDFKNACIKIKGRQDWIEHDAILAADGVRLNVR